MLSLEPQPCCLASRPSRAHSVRDGRLFFEEIDPVALAQCLEGPFVLVSRRQIEDNLTFVADAFRFHDARTSLIYRTGLPLSARLCGLLRETRAHIEAASPAEIALLCAHGVAASRIVVRGESGPETVAAALAVGADAISVSSPQEATALADAAALRDMRARCVVRLDSELAGGWWTRRPAAPLGSAFELMQARLAQVLAARSLALVGLAADLGPQVYEVEAYGQTAELLRGLAADLASTRGTALEFIELGGGMAGEEVVVSDAQGTPLGAAEGVACTATYDDYARAVAAVVAGREPQVRVDVGEGLLAGGATLFARLAAHDGGHRQGVADRSLALVGDGWLLPGGADHLWYAPTVVANRASELHSALHWVALPHTGRSAAGGAQRHALRRTLPTTTTAGDLLAFLDWGATGRREESAAGSGETEPTTLLVDGDRLSLLGTMVAP